jgi:hypothetical protein
MPALQLPMAHRGPSYQPEPKAVLPSLTYLALTPACTASLQALEVMMTHSDAPLIQNAYAGEVPGETLCLVPTRVSGHWLPALEAGTPPPHRVSRHTQPVVKPTFLLHDAVDVATLLSLQGGFPLMCRVGWG